MTCFFQHPSKCGHTISHANLVWPAWIRQAVSSAETVSGVPRLFWIWVSFEKVRIVIELLSS